MNFWFYIMHIKYQLINITYQLNQYVMLSHYSPSGDGQAAEATLY